MPSLPPRTVSTVLRWQKIGWVDRSSSRHPSHMSCSSSICSYRRYYRQLRVSAGQRVPIVSVVGCWSVCCSAVSPPGGAPPPPPPPPPPQTAAARFLRIFPPRRRRLFARGRGVALPWRCSATLVALWWAGGRAVRLSPPPRFSENGEREHLGSRQTYDRRRFASVGCGFLRS